MTDEAPLMVSFEIAGKDPEIDAIDVCIQALASLTPVEQDRVTRYLAERHDVQEQDR